MLAQGLVALSIVIRLHDAYGIPDDQLARGRKTTEGIMKAAGVAVTWRECPCTSPVSSNELVVRITRVIPGSTPGSMGSSVIDIPRRVGTLATVFADRVQAMAAAAGVDRGELLGRVIAHEVSHLLLGTRDHQPFGLMRGQWRAGELATQGPSRWRLSSDEGARIRQAIRRRAAAPLLPAMIAVDADPVPDAAAQ
jgi:hypothetical protein